MAATFHFETAKVPLNQVSGSLSGRWERFTRGDCPICAGARKDRDCRRSPQGLVHCRSGLEPPAGWVYRGEDTLGFGLYAPGQGDSSFTPPPKPPISGPQWRVLGATERDRQFRQIARHSGLSHKHRTKLQKRGVEGETIQAWYDSGFVWSWSAGATIPGVTPELPGVDPRTGRLRDRFHGMAIAVLDLDGHILGAQLKNDRNQQNYYWVSSASIDGNNQRLPNGETPLGVYGQPASTLNFCEGYLKGAVAADRHGICCIGMMGGHWAAAPEQLHAIIERTGATTFILNPDAGMLDWGHRTVIAAYSHLHDWLNRQGKTLLVRWWGQQHKTDGDLDEIAPDHFRQAPLMSWAAFLSHLDYDWDIQAMATNLLTTCKDHLDQATTRYLREIQGYKTPQPRLKNLGRSPDTVTGDATALPQTDDPAGAAITRWHPQRRYVLEVLPGSVPAFEDWQAMGRPQLYAPRQAHNDLLEELIQKGYGTILLNGTGGDGKTHRAGDFAQSWPTRRQRIEGCQQGTLHLTSPNYRNPDTATVERIEEKVSPAALDEDPTKLTPLGHPYRKRHGPRRDQEPDIPGLCCEDATIQRLQQKGLVLERGFQSDYCQHVCGMAFRCPYLAEKQAQGQPAVIREHLSTITLTPTPENLPEGEKPQNGDVILVDEASRTLSPYRQVITATVHDMAQEIGRFADRHVDLYARYKPVFDAISQGIRRAIAEGGNGNPYDIPFATVLPFLPAYQHLEQLFVECHFDYASWIAAKDVWDWEGDRGVASLEQLMALLRRSNRPHDWTDAIEAAKASGSQVSGEVLERWISPQPLYRTYAAIKGHAKEGSRGNLTVSPSGMLTFTYGDRRMMTPLRQARAVILMDATPNLWELSRVLGVPPTGIVRLADYRPSYSNLKIKVVTGLGKTCASRASLTANGTLVRQGQYDIQQRTIKLVAAIAQANASSSAPEKTVGVLDYKKFIDTYQAIPNLVTGYCFHDNRGSNRFKDCSTLISVAIATPNLGAKLTEYYLMTGQAHTLEEASGRFWAWQRQGQINELLQDGFRLRTQHRPDETLEWYILSDQLDQGMVEALQRNFPGCQIELVPVVRLCPEAAPKTVQVQHRLVEVLYAQIAAEETATIEAIATQVGRSKGRISQLAKDLDPGGFRAVRRSLEMLYSSLNSNIKLTELPADALFLATTYLPELAAQLLHGEMSADDAHEEFQMIAEIFSESEVEAILVTTPAETIATLITSFLPIVGDGVLEWVTAEMRSRLDHYLRIP
ncbi:MAG: hypothetical protein F6K30_06655 [Cyanothece sp. SIO2G6]|nr:hypothetical protein [Cyanothece sp. SIO2G6]